MGLNLLAQFDKTPTTPILVFEAAILLGTIIILEVLSRRRTKILQKFLIAATGVLIFEIFTAPMWNNYKLGWWAYVYRDVSWILTIGWSTLVLTSIFLVDKLWPKLRESQRFLLYLAILTPTVFILEAIVENLGIRSYAPEVLQVVGTSRMPLFNVPWQGLYYVPVFMSFVIAFYKYWTMFLDKVPVVPVKNHAWIRNLVLSFIAVFFFELMIEPMIVNARFPDWSYVHQDISILMTAAWVLIIWIATGLVDKFFIHLDLAKKFALYLLVGTLIFLPLETWFIVNGFRIYGPSAVENFIGVAIPGINIPIEVALATPFYLALMVSFIRYWQIVLDNKR